MQNDGPHVWAVSKIALAPIMVSRLRHLAVGKPGKGIAGWGFGSLSGSPGIHFRISTVSILKGERVSSIDLTTYKGCATGSSENVENRFSKIPRIPISN
jgi:hypothetical protein